MLTALELHDLFDRLGVPSAGRKLIEEARRCAPVREVKSNSNNVITRYASRKMARMIATESRTVEYPAVIHYEHDPEVMEYYAQPMKLDVWWGGPEGKASTRNLHYPDFLVIRRDGFLVEEWREEPRLQRLAAKHPDRFSKDESGWRYPAMEEYLAERGIAYRLRSAMEHPRVFIRNLDFLSDYLDTACSPVEEKRLEAIKAQFRGQATLPLLHLLGRGKPSEEDANRQGVEQAECLYTSDDVYKAIADRHLTFDLENDLVSETHRVMVFRDLAALRLCRSLEEGEYAQGGALPERRDASIVVGAQVDYDGKAYKILRLGQESATLQNEEASFDLKITELSQLHLAGKITIQGTTRPDSSPAESVAGLSPAAIDEILQRAKWLDQAKDDPSSIPRSSRTLRRYRSKMLEAGDNFTGQRFALASRVEHRGNRTRRVTDRILELIAQVVKEYFNTPRNISKIAAYRFFLAACAAEELRACTMKTFNKEVEALRSVRSQKGKRMAYQMAPMVWYLKLDESVHGCRPFQYIHIDHTQLDILLVSTETRAVLGKPWLSLAMDAESRNVVGYYLTFEPPSFRSCVMILRDIVRRHHQMPGMLVLDNGKEFHSRALGRVCELYGSSIRFRPSGQPRSGSLVERLFGTTNTEFIHILEGNTKLLKNPRSLTKSVLPENFAVWTLPMLHGALDHYFFKVYGESKHPALGEAPLRFFQRRMLETGERVHRLVRYDETFRIETCPPPPESTTRDIDGQRGIKINHLWFWNSAFIKPELRKQEVEVRMDPWDVGTVYALVHNHWLPCVSKMQPLLRRYTDVERRYLFDEIANRMGGRLRDFNAHRLVEWIHVMKRENFDAKPFERQAEEKNLYEGLGMAKGLEASCQPSKGGSQPVPQRGTPRSVEPGSEEMLVPVPDWGVPAFSEEDFSLF